MEIQETKKSAQAMSQDVPFRSPPWKRNGWSGNLRRVDNAVVVPSNERSLVQPSGVFDDHGRYCHDAVLWRAKPLMEPPPIPSPDDITENLPGHWMWGGVMLNHFGHFLLETLGRTWGIDAVPEPLDGILFMAKRGNESATSPLLRPDSSGEGVLNPFQKRLFELFEIDVPICLVQAPISAQHLWIPGQGFGMGRLATGTEKFRNFVETRFAHGIQADGPERLYISRSAYGARRGGVVGEVHIESHLAEAGYEIFHPQKHSVETQIARYKAARQIVALDGSALHLLAMVGTKRQQVAMIRRRSSVISNGIVSHMTSFMGREPIVIDAIKTNWIRSDRRRVDRFSMGELDIEEIGRTLVAQGLLESSENWKNIKIEERDQFFRDIESTDGLTFFCA